MTPPIRSRLGYIDWMRGLAAAIMLQGHVFESWVQPQDRTGEWFWLTQFLGGLPAPMFLFLVGVSLSLVIERLRQRETPLWEMAQNIARRAGWILLLAYIFRLQQFLVWYPYARWQDIFKVDTLNCIGASMLLVGLASLPFRSRRMNAAAMGAASLLLAFLTPFLYPMDPGLPAGLQSYFNGGGRPEYFSVVPWMAFALAGMCAGSFLLDARERSGEAGYFSAVAVGGALAYGIGSAMSLSPVFEYGFFDYSITSPHFFLVRLGMVLLIFYGAWRWSLRATAAAWSPLRTLGQASLLVYWVHIELVYGPLLHYFFSRSLTVSGAALQLIWVVPAMIFLADKRIAWGARGARAVRAVAERSLRKAEEFR